MKRLCFTLFILLINFNLALKEFFEEIFNLLPNAKNT